MPDRFPPFRRLGFAALLLLAALVLRWPALERQIWNLDEGSTITMAQMVLAGHVPYLEAADNRTPLVPYLKALILWVAGDWNVDAVHIGVALMLGLTAILLWQIARRLGQETAGVMAAIVFTWLSLGLLPAVDALTAHTGWFVIFFSSLGFWIFSHTVQRPSAKLAMAAGLAFGLSHLAKQPGLLDFGVCLILVLLLAAREPGARVRLTQTALPLLAGFLVPLGIMLAYFYHRGALADLILYAWTYNTKYYIPEVPLDGRLLAIRIPFELLLTRMPVILLLGLAAAAVLLRTALGGLKRGAFAPTLPAWLILGWTASGLVSTTLSGRDFSHYSMQVLPGLSLACGWLLARLHEKARQWRTAGQLQRWRAWQLAAGLILASLAVPTLFWLRAIDTNDGITADIGRVVKANTQRSERIFVWGYVPEIHVFAERLPSTRFFYTVWVTGMIPWTNLDWMKDTTYAILPGTPGILRRDFERRPPAVVVDTLNTRGYAKYPLQKQTWLWETVQREFAEIAPDYTKPRGFRIYRRIAAAAYGQPFPVETTVDPAVTLKVVAQTRPETVPVSVDYPAGTTHVELYKDGELYRRIGCQPDQAGSVAFFVLGSDLPNGERKLQARATGQKNLASRLGTLVVDPTLPDVPPTGPSLEFDGRKIPPLEATTLNGPVAPGSLPGTWDASTPSKLVYERPAGLYTLEFEYGMNDMVYREPEKWKTDGVEMVLQFEPADGGPPLTLFRRYLNPQVLGDDRGVQQARIVLPLNSPGRLVFFMSPGPLSDITSDQAYWKSIRGDGPPGGISFRDQHLHASHLEIPLGLQLAEAEGGEVVMAHAPSRMDFALQKGMHRLKGVIGLLPGAWTGPKKSAGAIFEVWHVPVTGDPRKLFERRLDPRNNPGERTALDFNLGLPYPNEGSVRLVTRPAHPQDNAFNYTYWGKLVAEEFSTSINTPAAKLSSVQAETIYGFSEMEEANRKIIFAHAPSRLVFPLPATGRRLSGSIGLLAEAYAGPDATAGGMFAVEWEDATGTRTLIWQKQLNPRDNPADRGFIPFAVDLPPGAAGRLVLRTAARPGEGPGRSWTFWHNLRLDP